MAYFSNGTEGRVLDEQCSDCPLGAGWNDPDQPLLFDVERTMRYCPVAFVQGMYNYDQIKKGNEKLREAMSLLVEDKQGQCQVRQQLLELRQEAE